MVCHMSMSKCPIKSFEEGKKEIKKEACHHLSLTSLIKQESKLMRHKHKT